MTPRKVADLRPVISGTLAAIALLGTIAAALLGKDQATVNLLGGFATTFGALAFGIQSEVRK